MGEEQLKAGSVVFVADEKHIKYGHVGTIVECIGAVTRCNDDDDGEECIDHSYSVNFDGERLNCFRSSLRLNASETSGSVQKQINEKYADSTITMMIEAAENLNENISLIKHKIDDLHKQEIKHEEKLESIMNSIPFRVGQVWKTRDEQLFVVFDVVHNDKKSEHLITILTNREHGVVYGDSLKFLMFERYYEVQVREKLKPILIHDDLLLDDVVGFDSGDCMNRVSDAINFMKKLIN